MSTPRRRPRGPATLAAAAAAVALAVGLAACGSAGVQVAQDSRDHPGAVLFAENCSGCHTLDVAGTQGSDNPADRTSGPNFNQRKENVQSVLYAIRNGGFSGAIMPANIVVGGRANEIADFVAKYAGRDAPPSAGATTTGAVTTPTETTTTKTTTTKTTTTRTTTTPAGGAQAAVFKQKCGACHTLKDAGTTGAAGPNLDDLKPTLARVLAAIANGGKSGTAMPKDLVTGRQAKLLAAYVSQVAGK